VVTWHLLETSVLYEVLKRAIIELTSFGPNEGVVGSSYFAYVQCVTTAPSFSFIGSFFHIEGVEGDMKLTRFELADA